MSQKEIELILARHLASYLAMPVFVADRLGNLVYYNEQAGVVLGHPFEESEDLPLYERLRALEPHDDSGESIPAEKLPLAVAIAEQRPVHCRLWIRGLDGVPRHIEATAFPLIGFGERHAGAVSVFWEIEEE
jgi:PAS domain-containing protein